MLKTINHQIDIFNMKAMYSIAIACGQALIKPQDNVDLWLNLLWINCK